MRTTVLPFSKSMIEVPDPVYYPNPFIDKTTIEFNIPEDGNVRIELYNAIGERIQVLSDHEDRAGKHTLALRAHELSVGNYYIRPETNGPV